MNILIVGVSGFIGQHLYHALCQQGHHLTGCSRQEISNINWQAFNFQQKQQDWEQQLQNIELVINAVGIYQQSAQQRFLQVHEQGPKILFDACEKLNIKVLQISAIGAEQEHPITEFLQTKRNADQYLLAQNRASVVLYPGIVLGEQGRSTRQLSVLAHLCCIPLVFGRNKELPLLSIYQLSDDVVDIINHWPETNKTLCLLAKPESMEQLLNNLRHWMGMGTGYFISIPKQLISLGFYFFPKLSLGAFNKQSLEMLSDYSYKKMPIAAKKSIAPTEPIASETATASLLKQQATSRFKKDIQIRFLFYINLIVLGIIWIVSGLSSSINIEQSRELISLLGITGSMGDVIIAIAATADILLGLLLWLSAGTPRLLRWVIYIQISVILIYTFILSVTIPIFWLHPFAPVVKNLAMLVLSMYLLIEDVK